MTAYILPEVRDICRILGVEPEAVTKLELTPSRARITRFRTARRIDPETGEPDVETLEYTLTETP